MKNYIFYFELTIIKMITGNINVSVKDLISTTAFFAIFSCCLYKNYSEEILPINKNVDDILKNKNPNLWCKNEIYENNLGCVAYKPRRKKIN